MLDFAVVGEENSFSKANPMTPRALKHRIRRNGRQWSDQRRGGAVQCEIHDAVRPPADHYFFKAQVEVTNPSDGNFFLLSATKTIPAPADLQSWTRDQFLDPDWLRVGTDIVGAVGDPATITQFNAAFSLSGSVVPEPSTWVMMLLGFAGLGFAGYRQAKKGPPRKRMNQRQRPTAPTICAR